MGRYRVFGFNSSNTFDDLSAAIEYAKHCIMVSIIDGEPVKWWKAMVVDNVMDMYMWWSCPEIGKWVYTYWMSGRGAEVYNEWYRKVVLDKVCSLCGIS